MAKLNWSTTNPQITDELVNVSSSTAFGLQHDVFYNKTGKLVTIWTGAGGTGTQLTESTDYTIGGTIADGSLPASITPDVAYSTVAITNATYHGPDLFVSYYPLGDYIEADDVAQLINGITPTVKDISASNQTTDLTVYEAGGSSALQAGSIVHVTWKDGEATYYHKFTSGGDFYNQFSPSGLAPGDGSTTFAWCGYGTGGLKLRLRENLVDWDVLNDGCFDKGINSTGQWMLYTNKSGKVSGSESGTTGNITIAMPLQLTYIEYKTEVVASIVGVSPAISSVWVEGTTTVKCYVANTSNIYYVTAYGEWRD